MNKSISVQDEKQLYIDFKNLLSLYGAKSVRELLVSRKFNEIKKIYAKLFGDKKLNLTSMVMLHYPADYHSSYYVLYGGVSHSSFLPFSLLTGDAEFDATFSSKIKVSYPKSTNPQGILQVPHHGSKKDWIRFKSYFSTFDCNIVSFGSTNMYGHPYSSISTDVFPKDYYEVTEASHFIYHITKYKYTYSPIVCVE